MNASFNFFFFPLIYTDIYTQLKAYVSLSSYVPCSFLSCLLLGGDLVVPSLVSPQLCLYTAPECPLPCWTTRALEVTKGCRGNGMRGRMLLLSSEPVTQASAGERGGGGGGCEGRAEKKTHGFPPPSSASGAEPPPSTPRGSKTTGM